MRQGITPAFNRWGIPGVDFIKSAVAGSPTAIYFGYRFTSPQIECVYTGAFSPHHILKPAKDKVNAKAWVHWYGDATDTYGVPPTVGWCATLHMLKENHEAGDDEIVNDSYDKYFVDMSLKVDSSGTLGHPRANAYDSKGKVDWMSFEGTFDLNLKYPYFQMAQGFGSINLSLKNRGIKGIQKTPIYQVKKGPSGVYLDDTFAFYEMASDLESERPIGLVLSVYRMFSQDATVAGDVANGILGTDDLVDEDALFLGLEVQLE